MTSEALKTATEGTGDEDLGVILRQMHLKHPEMSAEKVRASILEEHPDWKVSVKRLKILKKKLNLQTHTPHLKTSNASTDEPFDHNAYLKDWSNQLQRELTSERPRISAKEYAKQRSDGIPSSVVLLKLQSQVTGLMVVSENDLVQRETDPEAKSFTYLPYQIFYQEWKYCFGPNPSEPVPEAMPIATNEEPSLHFTLFPYGVGHWLGPGGHPVDITFEEYALHSLKLADDRFKKSKEWLTWVLTKTMDKSLIASVNLVLMVEHGLRAIHRGQGQVPILNNMTDDF